jgi:hypothetical protein
MHKTKLSGHYDREITATSRQGRPLRGRMSVHDGALRVTTPEGRWNATQVGGSPPQALAKLMLIEMEEARLGNPMFTAAGFTHASRFPNQDGRQRSHLSMFDTF